MTSLRGFLTTDKEEFTARQEDGGWLVHSHEENTQKVIGGRGEPLEESPTCSRKGRQSQGLDPRVTPSLIADFQADFKPNPQ